MKKEIKKKIIEILKRYRNELFTGGKFEKMFADQILDMVVKEIEKELHSFRANCKRLEEIKSPIQILDTSKNFFIQKIKTLLPP